MTALPVDVLGFWRAAGPEKWFAKSRPFDEAIRLKFEPTHHRAARGLERSLCAGLAGGRHRGR